MALPAFVAERRAVAPLLLGARCHIDRYLLPAQCSTANPPYAAAVIK